MRCAARFAQSMVLVVFERCFCKIRAAHHSPWCWWYLYDRGLFRLCLNKYSRESCFSAHQKPQLIRLANPRHEEIAAIKSIVDWEAVWGNLDNNAHGEWLTGTYRAFAKQKLVKSFRRWRDRYPPSISFLNARHWHLLSFD